MRRPGYDAWKRIHEPEGEPKSEWPISWAFWTHERSDAMAAIMKELDGQEGSNDNRKVD